MKEEKVEVMAGVVWVTVNMAENGLITRLAAGT